MAPALGRSRGAKGLTMDLQLLLLGDVPVPRLVERARLAEANGYSTVWLADERFYREVYTCLGQIAAHTSTIFVGPCVTDPYARHPALTAIPHLHAFSKPEFSFLKSNLMVRETPVPRSCATANLTAQSAGRHATKGRQP